MLTCQAWSGHVAWLSLAWRDLAQPGQGQAKLDLTWPGLAWKPGQALQRLAVALLGQAGDGHAWPRLAKPGMPRQTWPGHPMSRLGANRSGLFWPCLVMYGQPRRGLQAWPRLVKPGRGLARPSSAKLDYAWPHHHGLA